MSGFFCQQHLDFSQGKHTKLDVNLLRFDVEQHNYYRSAFTCCPLVKVYSYQCCSRCPGEESAWCSCKGKHRFMVWVRKNCRFQVDEGQTGTITSDFLLCRPKLMAWREISQVTCCRVEACSLWPEVWRLHARHVPCRTTRGRSWLYFCLSLVHQFVLQPFLKIIHVV